MSDPRAVLWDMDGSLASEGIAITREQFLSSSGQRNDSIIPQWLGPAAMTFVLPCIQSSHAIPCFFRSLCSWSK
ncbi:MAG TPA: hypothetical protein VEK33_23930 [Terriglobales bacterium]|nr:hypothetical protein [Terriglobales bacterium]